MRREIRQCQRRTRADSQSITASPCLPEAVFLPPTPDLTQVISSPSSIQLPPPIPQTHHPGGKQPFDAFRLLAFHKAHRSARFVTPAANGAIILSRLATLCAIRTENGARAGGVGGTPRVGGGRRQVWECLRRVGAGLFVENVGLQWHC